MDPPLTPPENLRRIRNRRLAEVDWIFPTDYHIPTNSGASGRGTARRSSIHRSWFAYRWCSSHNWSCQ